MATVREGWSLGEAPRQDTVPAFYNDGSELWLAWIDASNGEYVADIEWPFVEDQARHTELESLGFKDAEDYPSL